MSNDLRRWMRLCETASHPIVDAHLAASVIDACLRHGFDISDMAQPSMWDDGDEADMDEDDLTIRNVLGAMHDEWHDVIQPAIHRDQLQVYRAVAVSSVLQLRSDALGKHWSTERTHAYPYWGKNARRWIVLQALVDLKYVDWANTFALHIEGGESEVELFQGTPVTITGVSWHSGRGPVDDPSGADLVGQTLTT